MTENSRPAPVPEQVTRLLEGVVTAVEVTQQALDRVAADPLKAWVHVDSHYALAQAEDQDDRLQLGKPTGALHGMPVGIKDVIDTDALPTTLGSHLYADRQPTSNAFVIDRLREAGAIVLGKTVTTEFAWMHQSATYNARSTRFSPGGSSSGSAAAVAAGQVPVALGTQTGGSVIRPASYNGVVGFKPTRGLISRRGVFQTSATLDQLGVFGTRVQDVCVVADAIQGFDAADPHSNPDPKPAMLQSLQAGSIQPPRICWLDMPYSDKYSPELLNGSNELCHTLADSRRVQFERISPPAFFLQLQACHKTIYDVEILQNLQQEWRYHSDQLSSTAVEGLQRAAKRSPDEYQEALELRDEANAWFAEFFNEVDAVLSPSAPDIAPAYGDGTGDPCCCVIWTLSGLPCLSLPLLTGRDNMPLGLQLIGGYDKDEVMLRAVSPLVSAIKNPS